MGPQRNTRHAARSPREHAVTNIPEFDLFCEARRLAPFSHPVLIQGETGAGKEAVARELHAANPSRRAGPFVTLNCGAIEAGTARSQLFGHTRGAFTGADRPRRGALRSAHRGTLFLDEIAELAPELQATLLRVLEDQEVAAVGSDRAEAVDFRLVAATHKDLMVEARAGRFRLDLYYRIAVLRLRVPPLRERGDDILVLADSILQGLGEFELDSDAALRIRSYPWPGNIRELRNVLVRAVARLGTGERILGTDLEFDEAICQLVPCAHSGYAARRELNAALQATGGNRSAAARRLGISRSTLYERIRRLAA